MLTYLDYFQQILVKIKNFFFCSLVREAVNFDFSKENLITLKRTRDTAERGTRGEERKGCPGCRKMTEIKLLAGM